MTPLFCKWIWRIRTTQFKQGEAERSGLQGCSAAGDRCLSMALTEIGPLLFLLKYPTIVFKLRTRFHILSKGENSVCYLLSPLPLYRDDICIFLILPERREKSFCCPCEAARPERRWAGSLLRAGPAQTRTRSLEARDSRAQVVPWVSPVTSSLFLGQQDERGPCARAVEQFHHASLLSHLQRGEEQVQVMSQAMAELATVPYLQRVSQEDEELVGFESQHSFWPLQAGRESRKGQGRVLCCCRVLWKSSKSLEFSNPPAVLWQRRS